MQLFFNVAVFYCLQSMAHGLSGLSGERAYVSRVGRDRLLFRRRALLPMVSKLQSGHARSHQCETSSSIITLPAPHKTDIFRFCQVCLFDFIAVVLVAVYIPESCCWLFETV